MLRNLLVLALLICLGVRPAHASPDNLTEPEKWVLERVNSGLSVTMPAGRNIIRASFVRRLLVGLVPQTAAFRRNGLRLEGAEIHERLDLSNIDVPYTVWLDGCRFLDAVSFEDSAFGHTLSLEGSVFAGPVDFSRLAVNGNLVLTGARFAHDGPLRDRPAVNLAALTGLVK